VLALRPDLAAGDVQGLPKALAMLLFGMINWTFTWLKPAGALSHAALAPVVSELFIGGLVALRAPQLNAAVSLRPRRGARSTAERAPA
jgi:hypothetical protein